jgi:hypothetical protein
MRDVIYVRIRYYARASRMDIYGVRSISMSGVEEGTMMRAGSNSWSKQCSGSGEKDKQTCDRKGKERPPESDEGRCDDLPA